LNRRHFSAGDRSDDPAERNIIVTEPYKDRLIRANPGELVEWTFDNRSGETLDLTVGNFRLPKRYEGKGGGPIPPIEFLDNGVAKTALVVRVMHGEKTTLRARVKKDLMPPAGLRWTYAYDIIDAGKKPPLDILLDPEIEIPK
jgi:hypothetical protein